MHWRGRGARPGRRGARAHGRQQPAGATTRRRPRVVSISRVRDVLRSSFWLVPAVCVCASVALGIGLIAWDRHLPATHAAFLYPGPAAGARSFLSSIVTAMISFTGLVFSITILVLQLTSGQFSPRVTRMFLRDRVIQLTLGVFVATFVYAIVVQRAVRGSSSDPTAVPRIAVTVAFVFVLASVGLFITYINHVANMIRVVSIIAVIAAESRSLLAQRYPRDLQPATLPRTLPPKAGSIPAPRPGVLVSINERAMAQLAEQHDCLIVLSLRVGDFIPAEAPLITLHSTRELDLGPLTADVLDEVALDTERTMQQDLAFGFRQLVDIAERALSPAVNDPTTACQVIDALHDLLRQLAIRQLPTGVHSSSDGHPLLITPQYQFEDFLTLAITEIWRYGRDAAQIPQRLTTMLTDLSSAALPCHQAALRRARAHLAR